MLYVPPQDINPGSGSTFVRGNKMGVYIILQLTEMEENEQYNTEKEREYGSAPHISLLGDDLISSNHNVC